MTKEKTHKFQEKMQGEMTYEQYFQSLYMGTVELARAFEKAIGKEKAQEITKKAAEEAGVRGIKQLVSMKPIESFEDFKLMIKGTNASPLMSHVLTVSYTDEEPKKLSCEITECLWAKIFKDVNAADLGYIICCNPDFATAKAYHPNIKLKRTKTLMQGDSCCDHTYYWKE